jgi:hypothetical protein
LFVLGRQSRPADCASQLFASALNERLAFPLAGLSGDRRRACARCRRLGGQAFRFRHPGHRHGAWLIGHPEEGRRMDRLDWARLPESLSRAKSVLPLLAAHDRSLAWA